MQHVCTIPFRITPYLRNIPSYTPELTRNLIQIKPINKNKRMIITEGFSEMKHDYLKNNVMIEKILLGEHRGNLKGIPWYKYDRALVNSPT